MHHSSDCIKAYSTAFSLLPDVLWIGHTIKTHQDATSRIHISYVTSNAISACIDYGYLSLAIKFLEQGLATTFQQLSQLKADLKVLPSEDAERLHWLSSQLYTKTSDNLVGVAIERNSLLKKYVRNLGSSTSCYPRPMKSCVMHHKMVQLPF
jgi:hypothetical protein